MEPEFFSLPQGANPERDLPFGTDELGRPMYRTVLGETYAITPGQREQWSSKPGSWGRVKEMVTGAATDAVEGIRQGVTAPGRALSGEPMTYGDAAATAGMAQMGGAAMPAPAGALRIFAGRNAKTADMDAMARAEGMAAQGASRDDIWRDTGWFQGVDGQWRWEIDDRGIDLRPHDESLRMADEMRGRSREIVAGINQRNAGLRTQPDLFPNELRAAHGDLRRQAAALKAEASLNYGPEWDPATIGQRAEYAVSGGLAEAYPNGMRDTIVRTEQAPNGYQGSFNGARNQLELSRAAEDQRSTLLHELQHLVQTEEGFARGSNPNEGLSMARDRVHGASLRTYDEMRRLAENLPPEQRQAFLAFKQDPDAPFAREAFAASGPAARRVLAAWDKSDALNRSGANLSGENAMAFYRRMAGEVEARNVQTRRNMTPEERRAAPPWRTEDVPKSAQIVRFGSSTQANASPALGVAVGTQTDDERKRELIEYLMSAGAMQ